MIVLAHLILAFLALGVVATLKQEHGVRRLLDAILGLLIAGIVFWAAGKVVRYWGPSSSPIDRPAQLGWGANSGGVPQVGFPQFTQTMSWMRHVR
jgi:hypothetical protein